MGVAGGPDMIENGLVLSLDASDRNSYVSGSTTWFDLSGNNNSGSLVNGPTFNTGSLGSIVFDGVNDYVNCGTSGKELIRTATSLSLNAVIYCTGFSNQQGTFAWAPLYSIDQFQNGNSYRKFVFYVQTENSIQSIQCDFFNGSGTRTFVNYSTTVLNTLLFLSATVDSNNTTLYVNGVQVNQTTGLIVNPNPQTSDFTLGARINTTYNGYFKGNIYSTQIYNRALSAQEVLQNYNATKGRYGL